MRKLWIIGMAILCTFLEIGAGWSWPVYDHRRLAFRARHCIPLPLPVEERCKNPVDVNVLYHALAIGAVEPDNSSAKGGDGLHSPKHAYNPEYPTETKDWDPSIRFVLNQPNSQINAGLALDAIRDEKEKVKRLLRNLTCESKQIDYEELYKAFGRLSHYPADLAGPLHAYSVGVDNRYHEGDMGADGIWFKGLWDYPKEGMIAHGQLEYFTGVGAQFDKLACSSKSPTNVAIYARDKMRGYASKYSSKSGYPGLMYDFHIETGNPMGEFTAAIPFFKSIGQVQAQDGLSGILYEWRDALTGFEPPPGCDKKPDGECESSTSRPGGDHPDDTFNVSTQSLSASQIELLEQAWNRLAVKKNKKSLIWYRMQEYLLDQYYLGNIDEESYHRLSQGYEMAPDVASKFYYGDYITTPDVAILGRGFALSMSDLLQNKFNEPVRRFNVNDFSPDAIKDYPVLIVPSGGFMGIEHSDIFKASLDGYVKDGGTLIVFAQQHGYEFSAVPAPPEPDGTFRKIGGYGWSEDQSCFVRAAYIETWHPILSGQSNSAPTLHLDGYFTIYPSNATVLLRRTANGQPALLMYDYGEGRVIVTSMYSDFALKQNQASAEEIALVRDMISWAKRPGELPVIRPGEIASVGLDARNGTTMDAASMKLLVFNPDRSVLLSEQTVNHTILAGHSVSIPFTYTTNQSSPLGIYPVDYILFDAEGRVIQPQRETDSGRFAVSRPPRSPYKEAQVNFSIHSDAEVYTWGLPITFTIIVFNDSDMDKAITAKYEGINQTIHVPAKGSNHMTYSRAASLKMPHYSEWWDFLRVAFYEGNTHLTSSNKNIKVYYPAVDVGVQMDKRYYGRGETGTIGVSLKNKIPTGCPVAVYLHVLQGSSSVFRDTKNVFLTPNGVLSLSMDFVLPQDAATGTYTAIVGATYEGMHLKGTGVGFHVLESQIAVTPVLPETYSNVMTIPFILNNTGKVNVSQGILGVSLKDPDWEMIHSADLSFALSPGESKTLDVLAPVPGPKFGNYTLIYSQSDETRTGNPTKISIPNSVTLSLSFDKPSYRIRETANLKVDLRNTGKFNLENLSVTVSAAGANYSDVKTISLGTNLNAITLNFGIPIPETLLPGAHPAEVAVRLSSGSQLAEMASLFVPESTLSISCPGVSDMKRGDPISIDITNTGGSDTTLTYMAALTDHGVNVSQHSGEDTLQAGQTKTYVLQVPFQAMDGPYILFVESLDQKTQRRTYFGKNLTVSGLKAELIVETDKDIYLSSENIIVSSRIVNQAYAIENGHLHLQIVNKCDGGMPTSYHLFTWDGAAWVSRGILHYPNVLETRLIDLSPYLPDPSGEYKVRIKHVGEDHAAIDYIGLVADSIVYTPISALNISANNDILAPLREGEGWSAFVLNHEIEVQWTGLPASNNLLLLMRAQEGEAEYSPCQERVYWETVVPLTLTPDTTVDLSHIANPIHESGQFYLQGKLFSQTGQMLSRGEYRFNVIHGDLGLRFHTDKAIYREGEPIHITGDVVNLGWIEETKITVRIYDHNGINISTDPFDIPAKGSYPISFTTTAGSRGIYQLYGVLYQNGSWLASVSEKYEVAILNLSATADLPSIVGDWEFPISITFDNDGKIPATVQVSATGGSLSDARTITIDPNERKLIQYIQSITSDATYAINITGDLVETITRTVSYGLKASIRFGDGSSELGVFSEGHIAIPVTITNTGDFMETVEVSFELNPGSLKQTKSYNLPQGAATTDTLFFDLTEGDYRITASSQKPDVSAQANLSVRKENQADMAVSIDKQTDGLIPVNILLTNLGFNEINGSVRITVRPSMGSVDAAWIGEEILSQLSPQRFQLITLHINPLAMQAGNYFLKATLLNNSQQVIADRSAEFEVQGANFRITQLPPYQTFTAGQEATFLFKVKNTGDQEGTIELRFKTYDLIDSTQKEWLKPGEEKAVSFNVMLPADLEERDYSASYELKDSVIQDVDISKGEIKYGLAGINLRFSANLNQHSYNEGDTARLAVRIESNNAAGQSLFARVNYDGYESEQSFMLHQTQTVTFDIPLTRITGEKLFYGIYHESGRSNHLNSIYIHKAGDILTMTTEKQVYQPGETIEVTITGNTTGLMTLSGPGGYEATFDFSNQVKKIFTLPSDMVAGTYFIHLQLSTPDAELITALHPFDVAGIQVKVLECKNDRGKYASSDTIATTLIVSSNATMPAVLRAWVVDPAGKYTGAGEQPVSLSSSEISLATHRSSFFTAFSGLHRLVYGIYSGDLLLVSGSEAFDVGDAVLLGLSTDRKDYPEGTEPVHVKVSLFGSIDGDLALQLDGNTVTSELVSLDGFEIRMAEIQDITPGYHTLRAILTAGGLRSIRETSFTYAMHPIPQPGIATTPTTMEFGSILLGSSSTQSFSVSNTGNVVLEINTVTLSGTNQEEFSLQNDHCSGKTISPGGTCTGDILFAPTSPGAKNASVSIPSNAASTPELTLPLSGTGITTLKIVISPEKGGRVMGAGIDCPEDCTEVFSTPGATIVLHAIPAEGYQFYSWSGDINDLQNPVTVGMDTYRNITANFTISTLPRTHIIDARAGLGGSIFPSGTVHVSHGENGTFSIVPNPCYQIADVLVDGISAGAIETYRFENVAAAHTIHAVFKPSLLITKTTPDVRNILVWLNFPWSSGKNCPERSLIEKALNEAGVGYEIVLDKKDFATELRNPSYTDFLILGDHHPMEDHFSEELREQVYSGKGIISSLFHRQNLNGDVFGIKCIGHFPEGDYPIEVLHSEAFDPAVFHSSGKMIRIEALRSDEIIGWITEVKKPKTTKSPGIIQRKYGKGKVLFFAFDFGLSARPGSTFGDLLRGSLNYIHPPRETAGLFPGQFAPVEIEFKSRGEHLSLSVIETCPPEIDIFDPTEGKWIRENPWRTQIDLVPDTPEKIFFYVLTPDKSGSYPLQTGIECLKDGKYHFYRDLVKEILIEKDSEMALADILSALSGLRVSGRERAKVNNAIDRLNQILSRNAIYEKDIEKNIDDLLKAINCLLEVTSVDLSSIRLKMDALLRMWEGRWYFFE